MIKITFVENSSCLKCTSVQKIMILIGAFVMCKKCAKEEFGDSLHIDDKTPFYKQKYKDWYKKFVASIN